MQLNSIPWQKRGNAFSIRRLVLCALKLLVVHPSELAFLSPLFHAPSSKSPFKFLRANQNTKTYITGSAAQAGAPGAPKPKDQRGRPGQRKKRVKGEAINHGRASKKHRRTRRAKAKFLKTRGEGQASKRKELKEKQSTTEEQATPAHTARQINDQREGQASKRKEQRKGDQPPKS